MNKEPEQPQSAWSGQYEETARRIFLMAHPLFEQIPPHSRALQEFLDRVELRKFAKDELVYTQFQEPHSIYLVRDGEIHIERTDPDTGAEILVGIEGRGSVFGEVSFLSGEHRSSNARAVLDSSVYIIPGDEFIHLMGHEPRMGRALAAILSSRLRERISKAHEPATPARVLTIMYPEDPQRGSRISALLAAELVSENPGPVVLCAFGGGGQFKHDPSMNLAGIMERWPDITINEIQARLNSPDRDFDMLKGDTLYTGEARLDKMAEAIPALLGRLRKYYSVILVDAGSYARHPVIARLISQSDGITLIRHVDPMHQDDLGNNPARWNETVSFCMENVDDFFERVVTVSDEPPGTTIRELNGVINRNSALYKQHVRIQSDDALSSRAPLLRKGIGRLARRLSGTSRGLCLGGGGARAFAHVGVLDILEQESIDFDAVVGTSMGSIIAAGYAMGRGAAEINSMLGRILPTSASVLDKTLPLVSFFRGHRLSKSILSGFGPATFEDMETPFYCNGSDLNTGRMILFDSGYVATALRASVSLPGVYPPVQIGEHSVVDGGVLNNLPGFILREKGYNRIIGVNVTPLEDARSGKVDVDKRRGLLRGLLDYFTMPPILNIVYRAITMEGQENLRLRVDDFDHVVHPNVTGYGVFDFEKREQIVELGRQAAREQIKDIKAALARKAMLKRRA